jgi:hypothetical protein
MKEPGRSAGEPTASQALINPNIESLPAERFERISAKTMSLGEIVSSLGPAWRDIGSGLHVLEWRCQDGRSFIVGATSVTDMTRAPMYARWKD